MKKVKKFSAFKKADLKIKKPVRLKGRIASLRHKIKKGKHGR